MATPYATATAALVLGENPELSADDLVHVLEATATDLGAPGRDDAYGYGLVNPRRRAARGVAAHDRPGHEGQRLLDRRPPTGACTRSAARTSTATSAGTRCPRRSSPRPRTPERQRATGSPAPTARSTRSATREYLGVAAGPAPELADRRHGRDAEGRGLRPARARRRHLHLRRRALLRLDRRLAAERAGARHDDDGRRHGLLVRRRRRRRVLVRRRALPRLDRRR